MSNQLVDPVIKINNETVAIVPNTFKFKGGFGESKLLPQSSGNGQVDTVFAENMEDKKSAVKFEMRVTSENIEYVKTLKQNKKNNAITAQEDTTNLTFLNMALVNDPETTCSPEGKIEFHFEGDTVR